MSVHLNYDYVPQVKFYRWLNKEELATLNYTSAVPLPRVGDRVRLPVGDDRELRFFKVVTVTHVYPVGRPDYPDEHPEIHVALLPEF